MLFQKNVRDAAEVAKVSMLTAALDLKRGAGMADIGVTVYDTWQTRASPHLTG